MKKYNRNKDEEDRDVKKYKRDKDEEDRDEKKFKRDRDNEDRDEKKYTVRGTKMRSTMTRKRHQDEQDRAQR